jgi:hypothetical protein
MINPSDRIPAHYSQRARTELSAAWEHLLTAASEAARQVGDTSRTRRSVARERAALARLALRGKLPTSHWRWAGAGLATGVVIGALAVAMLRRQAQPADPATPQQPDTPTALVDKVRTAAAAAGERASTAVHTAAEAARDAADRAREKVTSREPTAEPPPPPPAPPAPGSDK